jgi:hypothetical protein
MRDQSIIAIVIVACSAAVLIVRMATVAVLKIGDKKVKIIEAERGAPSDDRLQRVEMAIEAIAVEVERISEGQRFTTKLLNDAAQRAAPSFDRPGRINTPH